MLAPAIGLSMLVIFSGDPIASGEGLLSQQIFLPGHVELASLPAASLPVSDHVLCQCFQFDTMIKPDFFYLF